MLGISGIFSYNIQLLVLFCLFFVHKLFDFSILLSTRGGSASGFVFVFNIFAAA